MLALLLGAGTFPPAHADIGSNRARYFIQPGDTLADDLYLAAKEAVIDGVITRDLCAACQRYIVSGEVLGSINSASQYATIRGTVGNSVRAFAQNLAVDGLIGNSLFAFASDIQLGRTCRVANYAALFGGQVSMAGEIGGNLFISAGDVIISGKIAGDLDVRADKITIVQPAEITGTIKYKSKEEIKIDSGVVIGGGIERITPGPGEQDNEGGINWPARIILFLCALATGLLIVTIFKHHTFHAVDHLSKKTLASIGIGFVALCVTPIAVIVLLITLIGIPAGIMVLFAYTVFFYIAKIYVAVVLGRLILQAFQKAAVPKVGWSLVVGLICLTIIFMIPYLGKLVYFLTVFAGMGAIILGIKECRQALYSPAAPASHPTP